MSSKKELEMNAPHSRLTCGWNSSSSHPFSQPFVDQCIFCFMQPFGSLLDPFQNGRAMPLGDVAAKLRTQSMREKRETRDMRKWQEKHHCRAKGSKESPDCKTNSAKSLPNVTITIINFRKCYRDTGTWALFQNGRSGASEESQK